MVEFENVSVIYPSEDLMTLLATKATVSMNSSTHATGRPFEVRWIEEHNSWIYLGTLMNTSAGGQKNLADNWMKCCSKLDRNGCWCCQKEMVLYVAT